MYLHTYEVKQKYVEVKGGSRFLKREGTARVVIIVNLGCGLPGICTVIVCNAYNGM